MSKRRFLITEQEVGQRLDRVIARRDHGISRALARRLFETRHVWLDGKIAKKSDVARAGSEVAFEAPQPPHAEADETTPLDIVQQSNDWVVVRKPAGLPSVAALHKPRHNLAAALLARFPEMSRLPARATDAGLVHRLDTGTSGLMLAARTRAAWIALVEARKIGLLDREYWALVCPADVLPQGKIDYPLFSDPKNRRKVRVRKSGSGPSDRPASTRYELIKRGSRRALLRVVAPHAHRHQIRAHLSFIGHAIVNDELYGGQPEPVLDPGFGLHSSYIGCRLARIAPLQARDAVPDAFARLVGE